MHRRRILRGVALMALALAGNVAVAAESAGTSSSHEETFSRNEVVVAAERFFGKGAKGLAEVLQKAFDKYGERRPGAIRGALVRQSRRIRM